tara:strand:- start:1603 stop:1746 length:144 start_codon:yes stop_codon:yes gene_type:complete
MFEFLLVFVVFCLVLEIKPIKRFLKGDKQNSTLLKNIKKYEDDRKEK